MTGPHDSRSSDWLWVAALSFFVTGAFVGFLLTSIPAMSTGTWRIWVGARIAWQLGGALWFGAAVCSPFEAPRWKGLLPAAVLGLALTFFPLLDMARGPLIVDGVMVSTSVRRDMLMGGDGVQTPTIAVDVDIDTPDGRRTWTLKGRQANLWEDRFDDLEDPAKPVRLTILRHLDVLLDLEPRARHGD